MRRVAVLVGALRFCKSRKCCLVLPPIRKEGKKRKKKEGERERERITVSGMYMSVSESVGVFL